MLDFARGILRHRKLILITFVIALVLGSFLALKVPVNYDLSTYLPENTESTRALKEVKDLFGDALPNLDIILEDCDLADVLTAKKLIAADPDVVSVQWLDDVADVTQPLELLSPDYLENFYNNGTARLVVALGGKDFRHSLERIRRNLDQSLAKPVRLRGEAVGIARAAVSASSEVSHVFMIAVPMTFAILFLVTSSWFEPILFMLTIFAAIPLNLGTNIFLGSVSFITQSVGAILQLAVSMDYSIFLLNHFGRFRREGDGVEDAMAKAIAKSFSAVTASALTTVFGFIVLVFMQFRIGPDLGIVLAKGILFSLLSVLFLLPSLTLFSLKWVDRLTHRSFLPRVEALRSFACFAVKLGPLLMIVVLITVLPLIKAKNANHFLYGMGSFPKGSKEYEDRRIINEHFGEMQDLILLVPQGDAASEQLLHQDLEKLPYVKSVISYDGMVGYQIPEEAVPKEALNQLKSGQLSRFIVRAALPEEGPQTFQAAEELRALSTKYYDGEARWAGAPFSLLDMRDTIQADDVIVNGLALLSIGLVLFFSFRSFSLPFILIFCIEYAIWCNLAIPYFRQESLSYIGYLVISTIQLGATVDYAILSAQYYQEFRRRLNPREAAVEAVSMALPAITPPAFILSAMGFILAHFSTIPVVSGLGRVLGQGALLSLATVIFLLPSFLRYLDPLIRRTYLPSSFRLRKCERPTRQD